MKIRNLGIIAAGLIASASSGLGWAVEGQGSALLITPDDRGFVTVDFANENGAMGIQFDLVFENARGLDLSSCTAGLPKGVLGMCNLVGSTVKFAIASSEPLPTGQVGLIRIGNANVSQKISVEKPVLADGSGRPLSFESLVDRRDSIGVDRVKR